MNNIKKTLLFITILIGFVFPFVNTLVIFEMFILLIPFALVFLASLIFLIISLLNKKYKTQNKLFVFSIFPIFIIAQIVSSVTVNKIQRFRSNLIITEIEKIKSETGNLPEKKEIIGGIDYIKIKESENYVIKYSRGFAVDEKYYSENNKWISYR